MSFIKLSQNVFTGFKNNGKMFTIIHCIIIFLQAVQIMVKCLLYTLYNYIFTGCTDNGKMFTIYIV
jgi:hypothetical protein